MTPRQLFASAATLATGLTLASAAAAADCPVDKESLWDMNADEINAFYDCMEAKMARCYAQSDIPAASAYRNWTVTSTRPAVQGAHSARLLQTFANDIAADQYLKFQSEGVEMPAGSILAKESLAINNGKGTVGPLFVMTKLEEGESPETGDWTYTAIAASGKTMGISQSYCHDCHVQWKAHDNLAYPMEEVRVSN